MPLHDSKAGLRSIAIFESAKGTLVLLAGIGLLSLLHRPGRESAEHLLRHFHLNPAHHYPHIFVDLAANITDARLWLLASGAALYALFHYVEALGLWFQKRWAQWLGAISGGIFLPVEVYELYDRVSWTKGFVFVANLLVVGFLVWRLLSAEKSSGNPSSASSGPAA